MWKCIAFTLLLSVSFSCGDKDDPAYPDHGCVTGVSTARGGRETIGCWHREMYACGNNQACADEIARRYNLKTQDVRRVSSYTDVRFEANSACDCP